jgi:CHAT domain-containing protein
LLEGEFIERLRESRDGWSLMQTLEVIRRLLPPWEHAAAYRLLAGRVSDDDLTTATLLTYIAADDALAHSPRAIADRLIAVGLVKGDAPAAEVVDELVYPVVRRVRHGGVPWSRWWDVSGLQHLFVELWTARQLVTSPLDIVSRELQTTWQFSERTAAEMLANAPAADPYSLFPPDLFETSTTGEATKLLRGLVTSDQLRLGVEKGLASYLPELGSRPDLIEVVSRIRLRQDLKRAIRKFVRDNGPEKAARLQDDLAVWDEHLARFLPGLTAYELELIREPSAGIAYRDQCLTAGRHVWSPSPAETHALPTPDEADGAPKLAPPWMQDTVISGGARMFHDSIGPYPVWLLTTESRLAAAAAEVLGMPGEGGELAYLAANDLAEIKLKMPVTAGDPGPALVLSFVYPLDWVDQAWQLLHLAAAGYVRLVALRLTPDGVLLVHRTLVLELPSEICDKLTDVALTALRGLVGDDMYALRWNRAHYEPEDISAATFLANERAKGEDLLDEITREPPAGIQPQAWKTFQDASRSLARARANQAAAAADSRRDPELATAVDQALEDRQRAREIAHSTLDDMDWKAQRQRLIEALPDERSAFIHFFIKSGIIQAIYLARGQAEASLSSVHRGLIGDDSLVAAVQEWVVTGHPTSGWYHSLKGLLGVLAEDIIQPIADELHTDGINRLIISPTPPLDLLPLHAAPVNCGNTTRALCEIFDEVTYMPTVRMMTAISARLVSAAAPPLVVAHTGRGVPGFPVIAGPNLEAKILRDLYPESRTFAEEDAAPRRVLAAMTGSRLIHIAAHAHTSEDRWARGLVLHGDNRSQAVLRTGDILADGDLWGTQLVVLNACRTGSHRSAARVVQTLHGVEGAFLARGARAVISTFWEINDLIAVMFAALLHASIADGDTPGQAFRKAVTYLRSEGWRDQGRSENSVDRAEALLDMAIYTWRERLDLQVARNPLLWSVFKISGIT